MPNNPLRSRREVPLRMKMQVDQIEITGRGKSRQRVS